MNVLKAIAACMILFFSLPIWIYLQYKIMVMVQATELMWFLFCIYVPVLLFGSVVGKLVEKKT